MVIPRYNPLPTSEKGYSTRHTSTHSVWRIFRQRQTVVRRVTLVALLVVVLCAGGLRFHLRAGQSVLPISPPTPFRLKGSPSSHSRLTDALDLAAPFPAPHRRPACAPITSLTHRYASLSPSKSNSTIYLALNLLNAESVLPTFIHELPILLSFMGSRRFHVSILENGSTDLTASLLVVLARALAAVGASYEIVVQGEAMKSHKEGGRRIVELARLRNDVMHSLYNGKAAEQLGIKHFDMVLFMNDVFWCASDMLEIIQQHVVQQAHMTCATDWGSNVVYDRWVARTISGQPFYAQESLLDYFNGPKAYSPPFPKPLPYDDHDRTQFERLHSFQVFSCWNGAAVIDARAFFATPSSHNGNNAATDDEDSLMPSDLLYPESDVGTQSLGGDGDGGSGSDAIRFRTARNDASPVTEKASECFLICVDLWRRGMRRIMLVPKASLAYELAQYEQIRQDGGRTLPHPIGIEPPTTIHSGTTGTGEWNDNNNDNDNNDHNTDAAPNEQEHDIKTQKQVAWRPTPPANVAYHDYAWWHEKERWGPWDEA